LIPEAEIQLDTSPNSSLRAGNLASDEVSLQTMEVGVTRRGKQDV
jgi:hypothetical protein